MKKDKNYNPNLEAKELREVFTEFDDSGKPLIDPFVYYDRPLDLNKPLPEIKQKIGVEYDVDWRQLEEKTGKIQCFDDFGKHMLMLLNNETNDNQNRKTSSELPKVNGKASATEVAKAMKELEASDKAYAVMRDFIKKVKVIVIEENFYIFDGISYSTKTNAEIARLIVKNCRNKIIGKSSAFVDDVRRFLLKEPDIFIEENAIPKNLIAFQNGILDIKSKQLYRHSSDFLTLYEVLANYFPERSISTPVFDKYLYSITQGNAELAERILQAIGYILTSDSNGKCFFLLQGVPNSGKTVFTNFLQRLFNKNAVTQLEAHLLGDKFTASELIGKAFCIFPDMAGSPMDEAAVSRIKTLTGNDPLFVPRKHTSNAEIICSAKIICTTNHPFLIKSKRGDEALNNRIITIPFAFSVPNEQKINDLEELLLKERDGIVTKSMQAYFRLVNNRYHFAGDFKPNEIIASDITIDIDCEVQIYKYVKNNFRAEQNGIVFVDDAYVEFSKSFGGICKNEFSQFFCQYATELHNGKKSRKRKNSSDNALSCVRGISFVEEGQI